VFTFVEAGKDGRTNPDSGNYKVDVLIKAQHEVDTRSEHDEVGGFYKQGFPF
jgi:hypothetical protein